MTPASTCTVPVEKASEDQGSVRVVTKESSNCNDDNYCSLILVLLLHNVALTK